MTGFIPHPRPELREREVVLCAALTHAPVEQIRAATEAYLSIRDFYEERDIAIQAMLANMQYDIQGPIEVLSMGEGESFAVTCQFDEDGERGLWLYYKSRAEAERVAAALNKVLADRKGK